jgi:hypothetical protein
MKLIRWLLGYVLPPAKQAAYIPVEARPWAELFAEYRKGKTDA